MRWSALVIHTNVCGQPVGVTGATDRLAVPDGEDPMPTPRFLTLDDVAETLNVSWSQAYALVRRKELIAIQIVVPRASAYFCWMNRSSSSVSTRH